MIRKYVVKDKIVNLYDEDKLVKSIPNDNNVLNYINYLNNLEVIDKQLDFSDIKINYYNKKLSSIKIISYIISLVIVIMMFLRIKILFLIMILLFLLLIYLLIDNINFNYKIYKINIKNSFLNNKKESYINSINSMNNIDYSNILNNGENLISKDEILKDYLKTMSGFYKSHYNKKHFNCSKNYIEDYYYNDVVKYILNESEA